MPDPVNYKVVDHPMHPSDPTSAETELNELGSQGWSLASVYPDRQRERTRWIFQQGPAGTSGGTAPMPFQEIVLGHIKGINYNVVGDTPIVIGSSKYVVTRGIGINNVGGGDVANIVVYTAPGGANGGGTELGVMFWTLDGVLSMWPVSSELPILTQNTLYIHVSPKEGVPATGDLYLMGYDLTGV